MNSVAGASRAVKRKINIYDASGLRPQLSVLCLVSSPQKHSLDVGYNVSPGLSVQRKRSFVQLVSCGSEAGLGCQVAYESHKALAENTV